MHEIVFAIIKNDANKYMKTKVKNSIGSEILENSFLTFMMGTIFHENLFCLKDMHIGVKQKSKYAKRLNTT